MLRILAADWPGEMQVALLRDGVLDEFHIDRPGAPDGIGDLHVGRVTGLVPAMAGAFVALDGADGFLPDTAGAAGLTEGDHVVVRVVRALNLDGGTSTAFWAKEPAFYRRELKTVRNFLGVEMKPGL